MENKLNKKRKYHRKSFIIRVIAEVQKLNPKDIRDIYEPSFWQLQGSQILDSAKIVLRNNRMTFCICILMLSLPTTIMNIFVYVTGKGK